MADVVQAPKKIALPRAHPGYWKAYNAWYSKTPKRLKANRLRNKIYSASENGKIVKKRCMKNWLSKNHDKKIEYMRKYNSMPLVKARKKIHDSKPERIQ